MSKSIHDFRGRSMTAVSQEKWDAYINYMKVDHENRTYDDDKYEWKMVYLKGNDAKYGRMMVSEKYELRRGLTMGEFYMNSPVD